MKKIIPLLFLSALLANATPVTIQLTGTSGISDGADYVLPYFLSINGGAPISAGCYDFSDQVTVGQVWQANELTLTQAVSTGQYSSDPNALEDYEMVGVLASMSTATAQDEIDLQHDLWNVFDPDTFTPDAGMSTYLATATAELPTFNFSGTEYLEGAIPGNQAFVIHNDTLRFPDSPEPGTILTAGIGLMLALVAMHKNYRINQPRVGSRVEGGDK